MATLKSWDEQSHLGAAINTSKLFPIDLTAQTDSSGRILEHTPRADTGSCPFQRGGTHVPSSPAHWDAAGVSCDRQNAPLILCQHCFAS